MGSNQNFVDAKHRKNDEFYTLVPDVAVEVQCYEKQLHGKSILCNCNDSEASAFWLYLSEQFTQLSLKKLVAVKYGKPAYKLIMTETGRITKTFLHGDGDFRSAECMKLLTESDVVISNPPFSLFREYIGMLLKARKDFLIIGSMNMLACHDIFPYFKAEVVHLGYHDVKCFSIKDGETRNFGNVLWYTTLHKELPDTVLRLSRYYVPDQYPHYDNYPAIDVCKVADIPCDYTGMMGVPITYLKKHNKEQFRIIGLTQGNDGMSKRYENLRQHRPDNTETNDSKANTSAVLLLKEKPEGIYYTASNAEGYLVCRYVRVLIQRVLY